MFLGAFVAFFSETITGAVIGTSPENSIGIFAIGIFLFGVLLLFVEAVAEREPVQGLADRREKNRLELDVDNSAHDAISADALRRRLKYMQEQELPGADPSKIPIGRYLSRKEENKIRKTILRYLPPSLSNKDIEVSISGSLSRVKKGKRKPTKTDGGSSWAIEDMESDQFYISDVDVNMAGRNIFDYIKSKWPVAILDSGALRDKASYKVTSDEFIDSRSANKGYMQNSPEWIKKMLKELSRYEFAGEKRPINIKFFNDLSLIQGTDRDILYKKD